MSIPLVILPCLAYAADVAILSTAVAGHIVNEPDYISSCLTTLRNQWRLLGGQAELVCTTLPKKVETKLGCDGMIAIENTLTGQFKILLFEAKQIKNKMDKVVISSSLPAQVEYLIATLPSVHSHLSDQIARQAQVLALNPGLAIIELFLCLRAPYGPFVGPNFDIHGSTCVKHADARDHVAPPGATPPLRNYTDAWKYKIDLPVVCGVIPGQNLQSTFQELIACSFGTPFRHQNGLLGLLQVFGGQPLRNVPKSRSLSSLLRDLGISHFLHVEGRAVGWSSDLR